MLFARQMLEIIEMERDIKRFLWKFDGSQNKGYLYATSLVGRKEERKELLSWKGILAAKCMSRMCVATVKALLNVWAEYASP